MKAFGDIDSKFRFVILASKRAKQLLQGDKPKVKSKSRNLIRIAQDEVRSGLVEYEIIEPKIEETPEKEDEGFIGEEIGIEGEETQEEAKKEVKGRKKPAKKVKKRIKEKEKEKQKEKEKDKEKEEKEKKKT